MPLFTPELEFSDDYPTIEPSLKLDFANARALDPRITFTRASVATYVGKDGLIKTAGVNEPRFDHDPTTGESLGLLIEEERTNEIINSRDLSFWDGAFSSSVEVVQTDTAIAPDGTQTADSMLGDGGSGRYTIRFSQTLATSTQFTFSVFVKKIQGVRYCALETASYGTWSDTGIVVFDLDTGTLLSNTIQGGGIEQYANGWYRIYGVSTTSTNGGNSGFYLNFSLSDGGSTLNPGPATNEGLYVWGAQVEAGSFPTSYIPTSGSTVTREKEFPAIETSSIDFKDFSQGGEGTLVCEFSNAGSTGSDIAVCFSGDTHTGATFVGLGTNSNRNVFNRVRVDATNTVLSVDSNFTTTGFYKVAFGIGQSRCTLAVRDSSSGVLEDTSVSYDSTPYTKIIFGCDQTSSSSNNMINGTIKSVFYYPTLLTDTQLQTLTQ